VLAVWLFILSKYRNELVVTGKVMEGSGYQRELFLTETTILAGCSIEHILSSSFSLKRAHPSR
jgi:hypothetical protein